LIERCKRHKRQTTPKKMTYWGQVNGWVSRN